MAIKITSRREAKIEALKALGNSALLISDDADIDGMDVTAFKMFNEELDKICLSLLDRANRLERNTKKKHSFI